MLRRFLYDLGNIILKTDFHYGFLGLMNCIFMEDCKRVFKKDKTMAKLQKPTRFEIE
jgi:hypothetical protein